MAGEQAICACTHANTHVRTPKYSLPCSLPSHQVFLSGPSEKASLWDAGLQAPSTRTFPAVINDRRCLYGRTDMHQSRQGCGQGWRWADVPQPPSWVCGPMTRTPVGARQQATRSIPHVADAGKTSRANPTSGARDAKNVCVLRWRIREPAGSAHQLPAPAHCSAPHPPSSYPGRVGV